MEILMGLLVLAAAVVAFGMFGLGAASVDQ